MSQNISTDLSEVFYYENRFVVEWDHPIATDNSGDSPIITCNPASGSNFTFGQTSVTCTAVDEYGNSKSCTFYVDVKRKCPEYSFFPKLHSVILANL